MPWATPSSGLAGVVGLVLFGMRPQYRAQSYLTFKMFFNALVE